MAFVTLVSLGARPVPQTSSTHGPLTAASVVGPWVATVSHGGETRLVGLTFEPADAGTVSVKMSIPALHVADVAVGKATVGETAVTLGPDFSLQYSPADDTLSGTLPGALVPLYKIPAVFRRGPVTAEPRPPLGGEIVSPVWTFDAGAPIWADVAYGQGLVFAGSDDGRLHALDAATGRERWTFTAGGPVRSHATIEGDALFFQADDGLLYRLDAQSGALRWKVRVSEKPVERLPPADPKSRYNRFASAALVSGKRLYLGTGDGHVLALDRDTGAQVWTFAAGDAVDTTPVLNGNGLYVGSFDRHVYALDAATGVLAWKHDTGGAVVSEPAVHNGHVIVGSRSYDLLALDAETGVPVWTRYIWFSWIESPAVVRDDIVYVGSSDAARLFAFDAATGRSRWDLDVMGWAWGRPAVSDTRVYIGTAGATSYGAHHLPGLLAADRSNGRVVWRFPMQVPASGTYGFPASPALAGDLVVIGGVDGRVYAFKP